MNKNKILLVYPNFYPPLKYKKEGNYRATPMPPLGPLALGSFIEKKGYEVKIIDMRLDCNTLEIVLKEAKDSLLIGFSVMTLQIKDALRIADAIKQHYIVPIIFGDSHPTLFPEQTCADKSVDFVIVREGEETLLELAKELQSKKPNFKRIKGLAYKENNKVIVNPFREYSDIEKLPAYNYDLTQTDYYINAQAQYTYQPVRKAVIETSRGCPHRCTFCINVLMGQRWRGKSPKKVVAEIKQLVKKYTVNHVSFVDPNCFVNKYRIKEICEGIITEGLNIKWDGDCRADYFSQNILDDELLQLIKKSGCHRLIIGVESGSTEVLNILSKDIKIEQILNMAKQCNKHKIIPLMSFMIGIPGEKRRDIIKTIRLRKKLKKMCPDAELGSTVFMPYPGGELYSGIVRSGTFKEPTSLRGWTQEKYLNYMSIDNVSVPWNKKDENYILAVHHYSMIAFAMSPNQIKALIRKNPIIGLGFLTFILLAKLRWHLEFFYLPFDRWLYLKAKKIMRIV